MAAYDGGHASKRQRTESNGFAGGQRGRVCAYLILYYANYDLACTFGKSLSKMYLFNVWPSASSGFPVALPAKLVPIHKLFLQTVYLIIYQLLVCKLFYDLNIVESVILSVHAVHWVG